LSHQIQTEIVIRNSNVNRNQELRGVLLIILGIFIFLSLISYNPSEEPTLSGGQHISNYMGYTGVFFSYYLIKQFVGLGAYYFSLMLLIWGWFIFTGKKLQWLLRQSSFSLFVLLVLLLLSSSGIRYSSLDIMQEYALLGFTVVSINTMIIDFLGLIGSIIIELAALLIIAQIWRKFSLIENYVKLKISVLNIVNFLKNKFKSHKKTHVKNKKVETKAEEAVTIDLKNKTPEETKDEKPVPQPPIEEVPVKIPEVVKPEISSEETPETEDVEQLDEIEIEEKIIEDEINYDKAKPRARWLEYKLPSVEFLDDPPNIITSEIDEEELKAKYRERAQLLVTTLAEFGVEGRVSHIAPGPVITRYEVKPGVGVRVSRIAGLSDDIARVMKAQSVRILAPIPGKNSVGIELPNEKPEIVAIKSAINSEKFTESKSLLNIAIGKTTSGEIYTADLANMPHLLIAGATGSGKSVCINGIITSLLYRARPDQVKFIMIDPKKLELSIYKKLQGYHLITTDNLDEYIITQPKNAIHALRAAVIEMERRYDVLTKVTVRNIEQYNDRAIDSDYEPLPYIIVIIDELADLMLTASKEIEEPIARLAQLARAVGIHLIVATQRPSVNVITGVIKANFPTRIAFKVAQKNDSRTILDMNGAEKLLGRGDMLYLGPGEPVPVRLHNAFVSLEEIEKVLEHIEDQPRAEEIKLTGPVEVSEDSSGLLSGDGARDPMFDDAIRVVVLGGQGSVSMLQRKLRVGYARAGRLMDELEFAGIVGPSNGSKARDVLVGPDFLDNPSFEDDIFDD
jgi:DNA segregation ATPase FtsK/SpoIIIE, S-DNA-T family